MLEALPNQAAQLLKCYFFLPYMSRHLDVFINKQYANTQLESPLVKLLADCFAESCRSRTAGFGQERNSSATGQKRPEYLALLAIR